MVKRLISPYSTTNLHGEGEDARCDMHINWEAKSDCRCWSGAHKSEEYHFWFIQYSRGRIKILSPVRIITPRVSTRSIITLCPPRYPLLSSPSLKQKHHQANTSPSSTPSDHASQHAPSSASGSTSQSPFCKTRTIPSPDATISSARKKPRSESKPFKLRKIARAYLVHRRRRFDGVAVRLDRSAGAGCICFFVLAVDL